MSTTPQIVGKPETKELVTSTILRVTGLNAQAFSGALNPSSIYTQMVSGYPSVFPYYREVREKDTAIISALETRRILALAREERVISADPSKDTGPAAQYADALKQFLDSIPGFRRARKELLSAPAYGYSVTEIGWKVNTGPAPVGRPDRATGAAGAIGVDKLTGRPQELFSFGALTDPQTGELRLSNFVGGQGVIVPPFKFLVASADAENGDRRGQPLLRRLFWASWFKRNVLRLHLHYLEKGPGTVVVKHPSSASPEEKTKALEAAMAIAEEIAVSVPETFNIMTEALQTTRTRDANDFRSLADYMDAEMTRIILGQTLTTRGAEQGRGTQALGSVHENLLFEVIRNDLADLEDVINEQLCLPWLRWTFGEQALDRTVRPYWRTEKDPPKDTSAALDQLAKARNLGARIAERTVYEEGQIEEPEESEDLLPPVALPMDIFGAPPSAAADGGRGRPEPPEEDEDEE